MALTPSTGGFLPTPGDFVRHPQCPDWGIGQVQSVDGQRVTVNFENAGKQLINVAVVALVPARPDT
jgi:transcription elongation factor GreA-like protein